jgi:hypothetical protein
LGKGERERYDGVAGSAKGYLRFLFLFFFPHLYPASEEELRCAQGKGKLPK